ncbi:peptide-methionine (S)-S-oxide reductase MsrA [Limibacter armeniacum]|uniref:peptide-methionine (S)-S-oxide reductase MsrA n=1 Tax=Limibacter armeniacum TaxID=466084 RepID=UPI002FE5FB65
MRYYLTIIGLLLVMTSNVMAQTPKTKTMENKQYETATFGAGCFWCVEAVFQRLKGVQKVASGYANGDIDNPTYRQVCSGLTGFAEVAQITFDPEVISFEQLLEVFWHSHNPTTLNRQGNDKGTQYRSGIYYHNATQKEIAEASLKRTDASGLWEAPIVTEIEPLRNYYVAEDYHQNYYNDNSNQPYCSFIIAPKIKKLHEEYGHLLKEEME